MAVMKCIFEFGLWNVDYRLYSTQRPQTIVHWLMVH